MEKQYQKMFKSTDHDKPHFHSYVFMFFTTISMSKKMCLFFRARAEKGIARHIGMSNVIWPLVIFDWFVLSMCMQVILDSLFALPVSAPIGDWTRLEDEDNIKWTSTSPIPDMKGVFSELHENYSTNNHTCIQVYL